MEWNEKAVTPLLADRSRQASEGEQAILHYTENIYYTAYADFTTPHPHIAAKITPWKMDLIGY